jgi:hypothetical protein
MASTSSSKLICIKRQSSSDGVQEFKRQSSRFKLIYDKTHPVLKKARDKQNSRIHAPGQTIGSILLATKHLVELLQVYSVKKTLANGRLVGI